ncbi:MAG: PorP/SprF family type IX secretion system membrane protein [Paludibacteraceae bacterium]|nr:PorP/SprF family type IX secretion system membrane protein [Paludibacteraceae bacterium]
MKKRILLITALTAFAAGVFAQDYTFSNHNIVPFSLNPASTGTAYAVRFAANYRMQWPMLDNAYHTLRVSYDQNVYKHMCSIGVAYTYDNMAHGVFQTNELDAVYSHTIRLTRDLRHFLRLGVQASLLSNRVNLDKLTFGDQYYAANGTILPTTVESFDSDNRTFFDFSVGASYVYEGRLNVGFAVFHVSRPDNGFVEGSQFLERKYVAQVNFSQDLELNRGLMSSPGSDNYFFANAAYQNQDCFNQVMLGAGVCFQPMIFGVTWKTNITKVFETASAEKETEEGTADTGVYFTAVNIPSLMVGAYYKGLQVYYIFDFNISAKKNGSWSNELSLIYTLPNKKKDLCPVTYW